MNVARSDIFPEPSVPRLVLLSPWVTIALGVSLRYSRRACNKNEHSRCSVGFSPPISAFVSTVMRLSAASRFSPLHLTGLGTPDFTFLQLIQWTAKARFVSPRCWIAFAFHAPTSHFFASSFPGSFSHQKSISGSTELQGALATKRFVKWRTFGSSLKYSPLHGAICFFPFRSRGSIVYY